MGALRAIDLNLFGSGKFISLMVMKFIRRIERFSNRPTGNYVPKYFSVCFHLRYWIISFPFASVVGNCCRNECLS